VLLTPDAVWLSPGDELTYHVTVRSNSDTTLSLLGAIRVFTPWGSSFWQKEPTPFQLAPMEEVGLILGEKIPQAAPPGDYTVAGYIGTREAGIIDLDSFEIGLIVP